MINEGLSIGSFLIKFTFYFSIIITTFLIYLFTDGEPYQVISFLPLCYLIVNSYFQVLSRKIKFQGGLVYKTGLLAIFIRYVVTPLSIAITGKFYRDGFYTQKENINLAILLMIFELIFIYLTIYIARRYYSNNVVIPSSIQVKPLKNTFVLNVFLVLGILVIITVDINLLFPSRFLILDEGFEKVQLDTSFDGFFSTIGKLVKPILFLTLLSLLYKKYIKNNNKIYIYLSFILTFLFMGSYTGTSRWELVFSGVIAIYLIKVLFGKIPKLLVVSIVFAMIVSFISISLYKFAWVVVDSTSPVRDIINAMFGMFQEYFSGPRLVADTFEMKKIYGNNIGLSTLINDFIGSIPVISGIVDQSNRINVYFNMYYNVPGNNLIIPMLGIGYTYFPIFPPIFTVICYWLLIKMDYKAEISKTIEFKYLYLYIGLYLSMTVGFNTQIIFSKFLIPFLPLLIIFKINNKLKIKNQS